MQVEMIPIDQVRPYWRNPRNNQAAVALVEESIRRFGVQQPIVTDRDGIIIVGHARYKAMRNLGMTTIPVVVASLNTKDAKAYRIADNKTAEASQWNSDLIPELRELGVDAMEMFFPNIDLKALIAQVGPALPDEQATAGTPAQDLAKRVSDQTAQQQQTNIELVCPHCGGSFFISKTDPGLRFQ